MNQYAIMPLSDYVGACDSIRSKTGTTEFIKSGELVEKIDDVFEAGKAQGGGDVTQNPIYYATDFSDKWSRATFPEGFNVVLEIKNVPSSMNSMFYQATGVKTVTLICNAEGTAIFNQMLRESSVEVLDLSNFKPVPSSINYFLYGNTSIVTIKGALDLSNCTSATYAFNVGMLKDIEFVKNTIYVSTSFANCSLLTAKSLNSIINGLSSEVTGQTLTLPKYNTVKATYDAVYGEGAWDAIVATKSNWTIAYS